MKGKKSLDNFLEIFLTVDIQVWRLFIIRIIGRIRNVAILSRATIELISKCETTFLTYSPASYFYLLNNWLKKYLDVKFLNY